jgi:hypothetical protein
MSAKEQCSFKNKAGDLQKENQVLVLNKLIGSLGSNKTQHTIACITISKAAIVIQDQLVNVKSSQATRKKNF